MYFPASVLMASGILSVFPAAVCPGLMTPSAFVHDMDGKGLPVAAQLSRISSPCVTVLFVGTAMTFGGSINYHQKITLLRENNLLLF
jgi:hypothetical protein